MKASDKPTPYLLIKAYTGSEWDCCDFAVIHVSEEWIEMQRKRLETIKPFYDDYYMCSLHYYDTSADFYQTGENDLPDIDGLLNEKDWVFVELETGEPEIFTVPENRLDCYRLILHRDGTAKYSAYGKHTCEEFWTDDIDLTMICNSFIQTKNQ